MQETNICPVSATMELIGGKYKGLILWHLAQGTLRFSELQKKIRSATPKMLTQQLRELEASKLIIRIPAHIQLITIKNPSRISLCGSREGYFSDSQCGVVDHIFRQL